MLIYKNNPTLPQGGPDIGLKVGILAEIGNMLHECALVYVQCSAKCKKGVRDVFEGATKAALQGKKRKPNPCSII